MIRAKQWRSMKWSFDAATLHFNTFFKHLFCEFYNQQFLINHKKMFCIFREIDEWTKERYWAACLFSRIALSLSCKKSKQIIN